LRECVSIIHPAPGVDAMPRLSILVLLASASLLGSAAADDARETHFELKIRPVLAGECLPCHGGKKISSGLKVDSREALLKGGDRGPAIVAGEPNGSLLIQAIRQVHDEVKMPPKRRLSDEVVAAFARWIADGAVWPADQSPTGAAPGRVVAKPRHWAFE